MRSSSRVPDLHTMHAREESKGAATRTCVQQHAKGGSSVPLSLLCSKDPREPANTSGSDERLLECEPLPSCLHDRKALCFSRVYGFWIVNARQGFRCSSALLSCCLDSRCHSRVPMLRRVLSPPFLSLSLLPLCFSLPQTQLTSSASPPEEGKSESRRHSADAGGCRFNSRSRAEKEEGSSCGCCDRKRREKQQEWLIHQLSSF